MKALIALPLVVALAGPEAFDALKAKAKEVDSVAKALQAVVGDCDNVEDIGEKIDCQENMKQRKADYTGKPVYAYLGPAERGALKFEGTRGSGVRVLWFPIHDAGRGLALTVGKPQKVNASGNLVIRPTILDGTPPSDVLPNDIGRLISTQNLAVEVIGTFGSTWTLRGKDGPKKGVEMKVKAVRLSNARNGKTVLVATF